MQEEDRKLQRKQNLKNRDFDRHSVDENYKQYKKHKQNIKEKKEDLEQEDWEYWKEYYK